jgi:anaerobic ribonucleoside-triphosphate reductase activating protein
MKIHRLLSVSQANGPGYRFVVWVQGCSRRCFGCFNPDTHDHNGGYEISVSEIISQIPFAEVSGITLSGGEPFEQPEELAVLLEKAAQRGLDRLVYTGYTYEELTLHENRWIAKSLSLIDILIDGSYKKEMPQDMLWAGSGNQRILQLRHGNIERRYKKEDVGTIAGSIDGELIIDQTGSVIVTGIFDSKTILG